MQLFVLIKRYYAVQFFKKVLGYFIGDICSCALLFKFFSTTPDGATMEYHISHRGFSDFLRTRIIVIFWTKCIDREVYSLLLMDNG